MKSWLTFSSAFAKYNESMENTDMDEREFHGLSGRFVKSTRKKIPSLGERAYKVILKSSSRNLEHVRAAASPNEVSKVLKLVILDNRG